MLRHIITMFGVSAAIGCSVKIHAAPLTFDYKDPKEISAVSLTIDSMLEPIVGYAKGISGTVNFDPTNPKATTGSVAVDVASIQFANEGYTATARGYALNGTKYPQLRFALRKVLTVAKTAANVYKGMVLADFTCRGITVPMTVPMTASYFAGRAEERTNGKYKGDLLILRTQFGVSRKRFGISEGIPDSMVGDVVQVGVAVVGIHYSPGQKTPQTESAPKAASRWTLEIEDRDEPQRATAEFVLNRTQPQATFETPAGRLTAEQVAFDGQKMMFQLAENAQVGKASGSIIFGKDGLTGTLQTAQETLRFHGRVAQPQADSVKPLFANAAQGPGFRNLNINADGKTWTLAERMKFHHVPGVSIARIENFRVVETGTFGVTNVETGEPADENTLFQAGSMGSPLISLLALRLAAQGKLDWHRQVNACLKSVQIPDNDLTRSRPITVLDLVNSRGGLSQYKFKGYRPEEKIPTLLELLRGGDPKEMEPLVVKTTPGTSESGGINVAILEQVLADITGKRLPALMQEYLFAPLGMTHSTYESVPVASPARKIALGHYATGEMTLDKFHIYPETGESGLWTTAGDFAKLLCEVQRMLAGMPNVLLEEAQRGLLSEVNAPDRVLGFVKGKSGYLYHGGASYGYYANHATHLSKGCGVVVMKNRNLSWGLNNEVIAAVARQHGWDQP